LYNVERAVKHWTSKQKENESTGNNVIIIMIIIIIKIKTKLKIQLLVITKGWRDITIKKICRQSDHEDVDNNPNKKEKIEEDEEE